MRKKNQQTAHRPLTLKLDGSEITAERFVKSVSAFVAIIKDVTESLSGDKNSIKWIVTVEKGSAVVHFTPKSVTVNPNVVRSTIRAVTNGFKEIEARAERPSYWSDAALRSAKEIASVYEPEGRALESIQVGLDNATFSSVTKNTGANVDSFVGVDRRAFGTVEGRLRTVTESGGIHVVVQDAVTHKNIRCFIEEQDSDRFVAAFRKRVSVYGEIRYGHDGFPISIKASDLRVMRDPDKLPSIDTVVGIYA